jgi:hypothetical protein
MIMGMWEYGIAEYAIAELGSYCIIFGGDSAL